MLFGVSITMFSMYYVYLVEASKKLILVTGLGSPFTGAMQETLGDMK